MKVIKCSDWPPGLCPVPLTLGTQPWYTQVYKMAWCIGFWYSGTFLNIFWPPGSHRVSFSRSLRRQSKANAYTECSALTGHGVKDVFDEAVLAALLPRHCHHHHLLWRCFCHHLQPRHFHHHHLLLTLCCHKFHHLGHNRAISRHREGEKDLLRERVSKKIN